MMALCLLKYNIRIDLSAAAVFFPLTLPLLP
jgi:hypothetical protein